MRVVPHGGGTHPARPRNRSGGAKLQTPLKAQCTEELDARHNARKSKPKYAGVDRHCDSDDQSQCRIGLRASKTENAKQPQEAGTGSRKHSFGVRDLKRNPQPLTHFAVRALQDPPNIFYEYAQRRSRLRKTFGSGRSVAATLFDREQHDCSDQHATCVGRAWHDGSDQHLNWNKKDEERWRGTKRGRPGDRERAVPQHPRPEQEKSRSNT